MKFRSIVTQSIPALTALAVLAGFQSCKPVRSEQVKPSGNEQEALSNRIVSGLKMDFYLAEDGSSIPNFDRPMPSKLMEGMVRDGQAVQLKKRVPMEPEKLFFAISDSVGALRVVDASYEHRTITPSNSTQGSTRRALLTYDQHQYYLAMDQLTQEGGDRLSSQDLQVLEFSLRLSDNSTSRFELRFYVKGELPSIDQVRVSQVANSPKISAQSMASQEGWTVLTERYKNPLSRPLILWFSAKDVSVQLLTQLGMILDPDSRRFSHADEVGMEPGPHQFSIASLDQVNLVIHDASKRDLKTMTLQNDSSAPIRIEPGQELLIEWKVLASERVPRCKAGEAASWNFRFCEMDGVIDHVKLKASEIQDCVRPRNILGERWESFPVSGTWAVRDYQIVGKLRPDVVLTEVIGTRERDLKKALSAGLAQRDPAQPFSSVTPANAQPDLSPLASCQGIF